MLGWLAALALSGAPEEGGLRWRAPEGCPDAAAVAERIAAAGGRGELVVDGEVSRLGGDAWQLALSLSLDGEADTRVLKASDCQALADAAVVLIAVRLDFAGVTVPPPSPSTPVPSMMLVNWIRSLLRSVGPARPAPEARFDVQRDP